jgi:DNA-binding response OmpR family regulator
VETKKRILIIDDEPDMAILLRQVLNDALFEADIALSGKGGIESAMSGHFDLILLDLRMPDIDGKEVLRQLRSHDRTRHTPVIFITGSAPDVDEVVAALDLEPADFVTKVISPKELIARIRWALKKHHTT